MSTKKDINKDKRILDEIKRLNGIYSKLSKNTKKVVKCLIENAAFMAVTLEDLQKEINLKGVISEYQNGQNQWGTKKSSEVEVYVSLSKNYTQIMKQLSDLIPKETVKQERDGFEEFVEKK